MDCCLFFLLLITLLPLFLGEKRRGEVGNICSGLFLNNAESFAYLVPLFCRYVEFYDAMSVPMAIALSGQPIRGQPVMVKPSEAEKNLVQSTSTTAAGAGGLTGSGPARRLYVGNLVPNITEEQLRVVMKFHSDCCTSPLIILLSGCNIQVLSFVSTICLNFFLFHNIF